MAWVKVPVENHALFHAALPTDPRVSTLRMFGSVCALVNGHMFGGLFARSAMARLSAADQREALALDGSEPFDPMGNGRVMNDMVFLAESVMDEPAELRGWLRKGFEHTLTLPPKAKKTKKPKATAKPTKTPPAKAATKPAAKPAKPATAKSARKSAAKPAKRATAAARPTAAARARGARPRATPRRAAPRSTPARAR